MGANRYNLLFGDKNPHEIEQNYEELQKFKKGAVELGCGGCIFSELFNFLFGKDSFIINPYFWTKDKELVRWFDDCDFTDDMDIVAHLRFSIMFLLDTIQKEKIDLDTYAGRAATVGLNIYGSKNDDILLNSAYRRHRHSKDYDKLLKKVQEIY